MQDQLYRQDFAAFNYDPFQSAPQRCTRQDAIGQFCAQLPGQVAGNVGRQLGDLCSLNMEGYSAAHQLTYSDPCSVRVRTAVAFPTATCQYGRGCGESQELLEVIEQCPENCAAAGLSGEEAY